MAAKTSKEVTDRERSCLFLLSAFSVQGLRVAELLAGLIRPHLLPDDGEPSFLSSIVALGRRLEASLKRLVRADEAVFLANLVLGEIRTGRDSGTALVARKIRRLRQTLEGQFEAPSFGRLGLESATPRSPVPLLRQADRIKEAFQGDFEKYLGEPFFDQPVDLSSQAADLGGSADDLRETIEQLDKARREFDEAVIEKKKAMDEHDDLFLHTARTFESYCRLAGESDLADRVRPSETRRGQTEKEPDEGALADGSEEAPGEAPSPAEEAPASPGAEPADGDPAPSA